MKNVKKSFTKLKAKQNTTSPLFTSGFTPSVENGVALVNSTDSRVFSFFKLFSKKSRGQRGAKKPIFTAGFTLVELMVVISIIALLSSIVLASVVSARKAGKTAFIQSQMRQYINALSIYESYKGGYPYPGDTFTRCLGHGPCASGGSLIGPAPTENSALTTGLDPYISGAPALNTGIITVFSGDYLGALYACSVPNSSNTLCLDAYITWPVNYIKSITTAKGGGMTTSLKGIN